MTGFVQKTLSQLLRSIAQEVPAPADLQDVAVTGVVFDSRKVEPGSIFVALQGGSADGHQYIPAAVQGGAVAVVGTQDVVGLDVPYIQTANSRKALAFLSAAFYDFPARALTVIGVTGTDGKTTTSNLIFQILRQAGTQVGMISTVNAVIGNEVLDTGFHVTTPEAPDVQRYLARMVAAGLTHVVLETTSHGLAQERVTGCDFDIGVVTNITHEHLDYHGTYEAYRAAKARLFTGLAETPPKLGGNPRLAVLNRDDSSYGYLHEVTSVRQISYSLEAGTADVWAEDICHTETGLAFSACSRDFRVAVTSRLMGQYNISNILAALAAAVYGMKVEPLVAAQGISTLAGIPGRMENIAMGQKFLAIVDFAHTPNALEVTLKAARQMTSGRVIVVFGSAGLRDRAKRRMMAEASTKLADISVFTAEDPRTESLADILVEMAHAAVDKGGVEGHSFFRVEDRGEALRLAVHMAQSGDLLIACGKGHEQSMCFGTVEYAWDDRIALQAALAELLDIPGPEMPRLPTSK